mmetsp:Transcript_18251/g.31491  ORF Transcript_18251/g.31491 Transcript_18251/m.31491 type:complete len:148 (+) Transcript_18251:1117-1560(+)
MFYGSWRALDWLTQHARLTLLSESAQGDHAAAVPATCGVQCTARPPHLLITTDSFQRSRAAEKPLRQFWICPFVTPSAAASRTLPLTVPTPHKACASKWACCPCNVSACGVPSSVDYMRDAKCLFQIFSDCLQLLELVIKLLNLNHW